MKKINIVIPVKKTSDRVKNKNFRKFYKNKSLFELLIEKLKKSNFVKNIYISSNKKSIEKKVNSLGCEFIYREDKYCNNVIPWSEMIYHTVKSLPINSNDDLAWCHTTTPLFDSYDDVFNEYFLKTKKTNDGLVTVSTFNEFIVNENKKPINYSWGPWHQYSQKLEKLYTITGTMFATKKINFLKNRYVISNNPYFYEISRYESLDIDDNYDFELARLLIKNKILKKYA
jgi:CMP-N-acetylneuraminic acid synthetase